MQTVDVLEFKITEQLVLRANDVGSTDLVLDVGSEITFVMFMY